MDTNPRTKYQAALRAVRGEDPGKIAQEMGTSAEDIERWKKQFVRAGKRALAIDFDGETPPTLDELMSVAQRGFPVEALRTAESCAGLFAARFYGKNDIVHVLSAGVPDVHVVDIDGPRIEAMSSIYPARWTYTVADVFELVHTYAAEGKRFDVVICDCYQPMALSVLRERYDAFKAITSRNLLVYGNKPMLDELGATEDPASLSQALSEIHGKPIQVVGLPVRSSAHGGTYWINIDVTANQS